MDEPVHLPFRLSDILGHVPVAYQWRITAAFFLVWLVYTALLIHVMSRFKWSDIAMSVCFLLIVLTPIAVMILFPSLRE